METQKLDYIFSSCLGICNLVDRIDMFVLVYLTGDDTAAIPLDDDVDSRRR